ncbi:MAG: DUF6531 domain-containing protein, partial [bacterium]|nr:DUF6531 domain-containing protein [bacterium]
MDTIARHSLTKVLAVVLSVLVVFQATITSAQATQSDEIKEQLQIADDSVENSFIGDEILGEDTSFREESVKYFRLKSGEYLAAGYPVAVHYRDETTQEYKEINNDLKKVSLDGKSYYTNEDNPFKVSVPETISQGEPILVSYKGHNIGLTYLEDNDNKTTAGDFEKKVKITNQSADIADEKSVSEAATKKEQIRASNKRKQKVSKVQSKAVYAPESNINFEYQLISGTLKENIIIKKKGEHRSFAFRLETNGLTAQLQADNSVLIIGKDGKSIFKMNAPFMYDSEGARTDNVQVTLDQSSNGYVYTMIPDRKWLGAKDRAYPVTIDPHLQAITSYSNVKDTTVSFKTRANTANASTLESNSEIAYLKVGKQYNGNELGAAIYFGIPSNIPKSARIINAKLYLAGYRGGLSTCSTDLKINAYRITSDWGVSNVSDNRVLYTDSSPSTPSYDGAALDYITYNDSQPLDSWDHVDITRAVQEWTNNSNNYGILLRGVNLPSTGDRYARFFDSDNGIDGSDPSYVFTFRDTRGVEDYWSYHSQSASRAGEGHVNDFNGNLVFTHEDFSTVNDLMTAKISHIYNSSASNESSRFGNGWRLNVMQTLEAVSSSSGVDPNIYPYVYTDEDGTKHYFYKDTDDGNKIKDEDGLGMVYSAYPNPTYDKKHQITFKDKSKLIFGTDSFLRNIIDANGNTTTFQYGPRTDGNFLGHLTDPTGAMISLTYNSDYSKLTKITDSSTGRVINYSYDQAGNLTEITYNDNSKSRYTYDGKLLYTVADSSNFGTRYRYQAGTYKVCRIERMHNSNVSESMKLDFSKTNKTTFTTHGKDGDYTTVNDNIVVTYQFDNYGHPVSVYDSVGNANSYKYYSGDTSPHKLMNSGSMQKPIVNLLSDYGMDSSAWTSHYNGSTNYAITKKTDIGYTGNSSFQVTRNDANGTCAIGQAVSLPPGTYTLSAYIKAENVAANEAADKGAGIWIDQKNAAGQLVRQELNRSVSGTTDSDFDNGWTRVSQTFTVTENNIISVVYAGISGVTGTVWIDSIQLEVGEVANKVNLVNNSGFEKLSGSGLESWTFKECPAGSGPASYAGSSRSAFINPTTAGRPQVMQAVNVKGQEGDVYSLSGYASTAGAHPGGEFRIGAAVLFNDGTAKWTTAEFNQAVPSSQFSSAVVVVDDGDPITKMSYSAIHIYVFYADQLNPVYFDNIQLVKDEGQSYAYDDEGNVVSSASSAESSAFDYDDNSNLKQLVDASGHHFGYAYDDKNNVTSAKNSDGV